VDNKVSELINCSICSQLGDQEWASQKYGWEQNDTFLPAASHELNLIRDLKPNSARALQLWQCPKCNTSYRYESDYEYLVNGSEDEQSLKRLSLEEADKLLNLPV
jgi:uncharacterized C2H2 Zn-finger protein